MYAMFGGVVTHIWQGTSLYEFQTLTHLRRNQPYDNLFFYITSPELSILEPLGE